MLSSNHNISINKLNVNCLNTPIKVQRSTQWSGEKNHSLVKCYPQVAQFIPNNIHSLKLK